MINLKTTKQALHRKLTALLLGFSLIFAGGSPQPVKAFDWSFFMPVKAETVPQLPKALPRATRRVVAVVATGYSSTPDQTDDTPDITANGKHVYDGLIAANWLPLGTRVKIPELFGDKILTVDDRMNERYGYGRIDIWFDAPLSEIREFGVKRVKMEVY